MHLWLYYHLSLKETLKVRIINFNLKTRVVIKRYTFCNQGGNSIFRMKMNDEINNINIINNINNINKICSDYIKMLIKILIKNNI